MTVRSKPINNLCWESRVGGAVSWPDVAQGRADLMFIAGLETTDPIHTDTLNRYVLCMYVLEMSSVGSCESGP